MIEFQEVKLKNLGVLQAKLPKDLWIATKNSIDTQFQNRNHMKKLKEQVFIEVSGIEETIKIQLSKEFHDFVSKLSLLYMKFFDQNLPKSSRISTLWANLQKKHEYRPYHMHWSKDDTFLSFVLYSKIPYKLEDEDKLPSHHDSQLFRNSRLEFMYHTIDGTKMVHQVNVDESYEGTMLIFPSTLFHMVYPFYTSDDYRISVAGNVQFTF